MAQKFEDTKTAMTNENGDKSSESNAMSNDSKGQTLNEEPMNQEIVTSDSDNANLPKKTESNEQSEANDVTKSSKLSANNLQDRIKNFLRSDTKQQTDKNQEVDVSAKINSEYYLDDEYTEHFLPQQVDTTDVAGELIQVTTSFTFFLFNQAHEIGFYRFQVDFIIMYCYQTRHNYTRGAEIWKNNSEEKIRGVI